MTTVRPTRRALLALLPVTLAGCVLAPPDVGPIALETQHGPRMAAMVSAYRAANGLGPVVVDPALTAAAAEQAERIAGRDRLSHGNFTGRIYRSAADPSRAWENLAAGDPTPEAALETWKGSPGHREALVAPEATRIGYVRARVPRGRHRTFDVLVLASD